MNLTETTKARLVGDGLLTGAQVERVGDVLDEHGVLAAAAVVKGACVRACDRDARGALLDVAAAIERGEGVEGLTVDERDGFVTPVQGGFEAAALGRVLGVFESEQDAGGAARLLAAGRPVWDVDLVGRRTLRV